MNYFGYIKKMALTLHNIRMMKRGRMPYHGAMFQLKIRDKGEFTFLIMGDTGAGKSETLEAMRHMGGEDIQDITIIADDMGSLQIMENGEVLGYGTETGAFVRLDDLQPGYAFGQIDRAIIMNVDQVNARVVLPVTTYEKVIKGTKIDFVLYANNYEVVDEAHPVIGRFNSKEEALPVFRDGKVMSKGTTNTSGLVGTFFANVFGPQQYPDLYDQLAEKYFAQMFKNGTFVGQLRTQLGVNGMERTGPEFAAKEILKFIKKM
jgi:energy-coupling factor transporter ATP-binding protein EcfA2